MSTEITLQVSDQVVRHARHVAARTQQRIEDVLAIWLEQIITDVPIAELSDDEVLALTELQLTAEQQAVLSHLLEQNREETLDVQGRRQLDDLMHLYEQGLLRKAQALREAVQRGLREPLQPWALRTLPQLDVNVSEKRPATDVVIAAVSNDMSWEHWKSSTLSHGPKVGVRTSRTFGCLAVFVTVIKDLKLRESTHTRMQLWGCLTRGLIYGMSIFAGVQTVHTLLALPISAGQQWQHWDSTMISPWKYAETGFWLAGTHLRDDIFATLPIFPCQTFM
jgi:hypothetical protein